MRHIAVEGRCFVLAPTRSRTPSDLAPELATCYRDPDDVVCRGGSVIVDPFGEVLAGPLHDEEGLLLADTRPRRGRPAAATISTPLATTPARHLPARRRHARRAAVEWRVAPTRAPEVRHAMLGAGAIGGLLAAALARGGRRCRAADAAASARRVSTARSWSRASCSATSRSLSPAAAHSTAMSTFYGWRQRLPASAMRSHWRPPGASGTPGRPAPEWRRPRRGPATRYATSPPPPSVSSPSGSRTAASASPRPSCVSTSPAAGRCSRARAPPGIECAFATTRRRSCGRSSRSSHRSRSRRRRSTRRLARCARTEAFARRRRGARSRACRRGGRRRRGAAGTGGQPAGNDAQLDAARRRGGTRAGARRDRRSDPPRWGRRRHRRNGNRGARRRRTPPRHPTARAPPCRMTRPPQAVSDALYDQRNDERATERISYRDLTSPADQRTPRESSSVSRCG